VNVAAQQLAAADIATVVAELARQHGVTLPVRTVLSAAAALGPEVVAEGVESTRQRDILRGVGCDNAQGYLLAQPLSARDLGRLLAADRQGAGLGLRTRNPRGCPTVSPT
jgi:EAL domain-containing protein (putative c-di-GMP-specific phosphodiesterase class I)